METLEITELKDSILLYLFDRASARISLSDVYYDLNPENIPMDVIQDYLEDMVVHNLIDRLPVSSGTRNLYYITERGKRRLKERGYTNRLEIESGNFSDQQKKR